MRRSTVAVQVGTRRRVEPLYGAAVEALERRHLVQLRVAHPYLEEPELRAQVWLMRTEMQEFFQGAGVLGERESRSQL